MLDMISNLLKSVLDINQGQEHDGTDEDSGLQLPEHSYLEKPPIPAQVHTILKECDGCAWQSEFTQRWDCSPATTSRRLSKMANENRIVKIQIGRRNLICLPGRVPVYLLESEQHAPHFDDRPRGVSSSNNPPHE